MKKLLGLVAAVSLVFGSFGAASAIPNGADYDAAGNPTAAAIAAVVATTGATLAGEGAAPNACIGISFDVCDDGLANGSGSGTIVPNTAVQHMDYLVTNLGNGLFSYQYQFENSSISFADIITIVNKLWTAIGTAPGDLDITGPHVVNGELETAPGGPESVSVSGTSVLGQNATWLGDSNGVAVGNETITMTLLGGPPVFATWLAQNDFSWNSINPNPTGEFGRPVLAPGLAPPTQVLEPISLLLIGAGLLGVGVAARRRK